MQNAKCKGAKEGFGCFDKWSRDRSVGCKYFLRRGLTPSPWPLASFFCRQCSKDKALVWRSTNTSRRPIWAKMPSIGCCPCCPIFKWLLTGYCRLFSPKHGKKCLFSSSFYHLYITETKKWPRLCHEMQQLQILWQIEALWGVLTVERDMGGVWRGV